MTRMRDEVCQCRRAFGPNDLPPRHHGLLERWHIHFDPNDNRPYKALSKDGSTRVYADGLALLTIRIVLAERVYMRDAPSGGREAGTFGGVPPLAVRDGDRDADSGARLTPQLPRQQPGASKPR